MYQHYICNYVLYTCHYIFGSSVAVGTNNPCGDMRLVSLRTGFRQTKIRKLCIVFLRYRKCSVRTFDYEAIIKWDS